ncbi:hypothetical protein SynROS8604_03757 [Synechococcus sp. ROS8604]|nr:hypothetical protein SynROS8604_03757 [Synechococcus sp. ROS8604]
MFMASWLAGLIELKMDHLMKELADCPLNECQNCLNFSL